MALFKILKGNRSGLDTQNIVNGYCYVTLDEQKMYIDHINANTGAATRFCLNADHADTAGSASKLDCGNVGNRTIPVYFADGVPQTCEQIKTETLTVNVNGANAGSFDGSQPVTINIDTISEEDVNDLLENYLPLSAGPEKKLTGPLGIPEGIMYGTTLPTTGFDGQLFFLAEDAEDPPLYVPEGGSTGDVLIKNSAVSGDYEWQKLETLPTGGSQGQALIKNSSTDKDASWKSSAISWTAGTTAGPKPNIFGVAGSAIPVANASASGIVTTDAQTFAGQKTFSTGITLSDAKQLQRIGYSRSWYNGRDGALIRQTSYNGYNPILSCKTTNGSWELGPYTSDYLHFVYSSDTGYNSGTNTSGEYTNAIKLASTGVLYGAAWNDYAEFRTQQEHIEPGYCVASADNGQVYKTTEKFQACDGIVSDTFGFAIGETDECKTPLAVAGRVLAYCEGNRYDYHSGDTVCAGPNGKVCKMSRKEIREWPDRIIGIVSEIPEYEHWGDGNVPVNGRIWIKVK